MTPKERIEEILDVLWQQGLLMDYETKGKDITQATTEILKAIRESLKEKERKDWHCQLREQDNPITFDRGYNQAIEDMKEKMK